MYKRQVETFSSVAEESYNLAVIGNIAAGSLQPGDTIPYHAVSYTHLHTHALHERFCFIPIRRFKPYAPLPWHQKSVILHGVVNTGTIPRAHSSGAGVHIKMPQQIQYVARSEPDAVSYTHLDVYKRQGVMSLLVAPLTELISGYL